MRGWLRGTTRRVVAAALALLIVGLAIAAAAAGGGSGRPAAGRPSATTATTATTATVPTAADITAAEACQAFVVYLGDARDGRVPEGVGSIVVRDASVLLRGARADEAAGRALPEWAPLGADIIAAAEDLVKHDVKAFGADGRTVAAQCQKIPAAAARIGGFRRASG